MKLTNKHGLPAPVVRALSFDNYSKGRADYSITELLDSPRVRKLQWLHAEQIEQDVTDNFFSLLGRAVHQILEWGADGAANTRPEERLFLEVSVDGMPITVSGSMDLQEGDGLDVVDITDYKVTSVLSATSDKLSWEQQLNLYAHLVRKVRNQRVGKLQIVAFLRDWRSSSAKRDKSYPQSPIIVIPVRKWTAAEAALFLQERIRLHMAADDDAMSGVELTPCTDEERWMGEPAWAVLKKGSERASRVFDTEDEAKDFIANAKKPDDLMIDRRGGEPRRCKGNWCRVARFCSVGRALFDEEFE